MSSSNRPVTVLVVACLFMAIGAVGVVRHFPGLKPWHQDDVWIELTELLAIVAGAFLLRGCSWARWLAVAWLAFHVAISFPQLQKVTVHAIICALIAWILFRPAAGRYFRGAPIEPA